MPAGAASQESWATPTVADAPGVAPPPVETVCPTGVIPPVGAGPMVEAGAPVAAVPAVAAASAVELVSPVAGVAAPEAVSLPLTALPADGADPPPHPVWDISTRKDSDSAAKDFFMFMRSPFFTIIGAINAKKPGRNIVSRYFGDPAVSVRPLGFPSHPCGRFSIIVHPCVAIFSNATR